MKGNVSCFYHVLNDFSLISITITSNLFLSSVTKSNLKFQTPNFSLNTLLAAILYILSPCRHLYGNSHHKNRTQKLIINTITSNLFLSSLTKSNLKFQTPNFSLNTLLAAILYILIPCRHLYGNSRHKNRTQKLIIWLLNILKAH